MGDSNCTNKKKNDARRISARDSGLLTQQKKCCHGRDSASIKN